MPSIIDTVMLGYIKRAAKEDDSLRPMLARYQRNRNLLWTRTMLYLTKVMTYRDMVKGLPFAGLELKTFFDAMTSHFDLMVGLKMAVLRSSIEPPRQAFAYYGVRFHPKLIKLLEPYSEQIRQRATGLDLDVSLTQIYQACGQAATEIEKSLSFFVRQRMRFVYTSNNYAHSDFVNDLLEHATKSYYLSVPFLPEAHARNSMRLSATNRGHNLVKYFKAERRQRLVKVGDESENTVISMFHYNDAGEHTVMPEVEASALRDSIFYATREFEIRHAIRQALKFYENDGVPAKRKAVKLILGQNSRDFVKFCRTRYKTCHGVRSVAHIRETVPLKRYFSFVRTYVGVSPRMFDRFLQELRSVLV